MAEQLCGKCQLPIHPADVDLRHFGFYTAHAEGTCISLLKAQRDAAVNYLAQPLMRGYFLPTMPTDLRALVDAARERQEKS